MKTIARSQTRLSQARNTLLAAAAMACLAALSPLHAQGVPALKFSGQTINTATSVTSTRGFSFDVTNPTGVTVTDLSIFDAGADGLLQSHDVGLWDSTGTLLASATLPAGSSAPLDANNLFRTVSITPLLLPAGTNYAVGAVFLVGSGDGQALNWTSLAVASGIAYDQARFINNGVASPSFPTSTGAFTGFPGGSFQIAGVPEPSTWAMLLGGLGLIGFLKRFRRAGKA